MTVLTYCPLTRVVRMSSRIRTADEAQAHIDDHFLAPDLDVPSELYFEDDDVCRNGKPIMECECC